MIKQVLIIAAMGLIHLAGNAQQASRFPITSGSVWRINYEYSCNGDAFRHENGDEEYKYYVGGDTVIAKRNYFKLYKTGIIFLDEPFLVEHKYMGAIRDSADRFFFIADEESSETMLYDFTVNVGDMIYVPGSDITYPVDEIILLENGRKQYILNLITVHCGSANTIIEGIGWLGGLLEGNSCLEHPGIRGSYLVCYSDNGQPVYETLHTRCGEKVICSGVISGVTDLNKPLRPAVMVHPGGMLRISLPDVTVGSADVQIIDTSGSLRYNQKIDLSTTLDISHLERGTYLLRLFKGANSYATKFIVP